MLSTHPGRARLQDGGCMGRFCCRSITTSHMLGCAHSWDHTSHGPEPSAFILLAAGSGCPCATAELMEPGRCWWGRAVLLSCRKVLAAAVGAAPGGNRFEQQRGGSYDSSGRLQVEVRWGRTGKGEVAFYLHRMIEMRTQQQQSPNRPSPAAQAPGILCVPAAEER